MFTSDSIINQADQASQSGPIYDELEWPINPHNGQRYSLAELAADPSLPLPQSKVALMLQRRHEATADASLPAETLSPREIKAQEAAQEQQTCFLSLPYSPLIVHIGGNPSLEYRLRLIYPVPETNPASGQPQLPVLDLGQHDLLPALILLAQGKTVLEELADLAAQPVCGPLAIGATMADTL